MTDWALFRSQVPERKLVVWRGHQCIVFCMPVVFTAVASGRSHSFTCARALSTPICSEAQFLLLGTYPNCSKASLLQEQPELYLPYCGIPALQPPLSHFMPH